MGFISGLTSNYLQSALGSILPVAGSTSNTTGSTSGASAASSQTDNQQLSPFAQLMSTLQQLQQSNPNEYQQVTQQIGANLQSAAQTAQADGSSTAANQLKQLATDFTNSSQSGQLPNMQDLAQAMTGGRHRHVNETAGDSGSSSSTVQSQLLAAFQSGGSQSDSLNPMSIILNTLSSAGISTSN